MDLVGAGTLSVKLSLQETFAWISRCGFQWVDLLLVSGWSQIGTKDLTTDRGACYATIDDALKQSGLSVASINAKFSVPFEDRSSEGARQRTAEYEALFALMDRLGVRRASVQSTLSSDACVVQRAHAQAMEEVFALETRAERLGFLFSLEPHIMSSVCTMDALNRVWNTYPGFRFTYDPSHLLYMGERLEDTDPIALRAGVAHLRDACSGRLLVPYGKGCFKMDRAVRALKQAGYDGPVVVEYMADLPDGRGMDTQMLKDMRKFCAALIDEWNAK